jgi:pyochelin biosynthetic protein PchC
MVSDNLWFRRYRTVEQPRVRLVCFPHAGGGPSLFRSWSRGLPADVEVIAVLYPGRLDRVNEPGAERMSDLVDPVRASFEPLLDRPVALFGHSMGAWVALEVAARLPVAPRALIVSGQVPPARRDTAPPGSARRADREPFRTDDQVIAEVRRIGGYDPSVFDHPELLKLILPPVRTDFEVVRTYRQASSYALTCPVLACYGTDDQDARPEDVAHWREVSTGRYDQRSFPGDHFYLSLRTSEPALLAAITAALADPPGQCPIPAPPSTGITAPVT